VILSSPRARGLALDVAAVAVILAVGLEMWPMGRLPGAPTLPVETPGWATFNDVVLSGPDAGEWGSAANALHQGRLEDLDAHRMPTWTILTAAMMALSGLDVALAGHLVNHLLMLALPLIIYALGRQGMGRWMALAAALTVAACPPLVGTSRRFGVDITVATLIPASLLAASWAARRWWLAPLAGAAAALAAASHYTAIPFPLPALILILLMGRGWLPRLGSAVLFAAACAGGLWAIFEVFPLPSAEAFSRDMAEGIARGSQTGVGGRASDWTRPLEILRDGQADAIPDAIKGMVEWICPPWMPWSVALAAPWLGVVGLLGAPRLAWNRPWRVPLQGLPLGVPLLLALAPLPFLAAAQAPERYSYNLLPIATLLFARGLDALPAAVDALARRYRPGWWAGWLALPLALPLIATTQGTADRWLTVKPPMLEDVATWKLSRALAAEFEPGGEVACPVREANVMAGRDYCPDTRCPVNSSDKAFWVCLEQMDSECSGEGDLAYVVAIKSRFDERGDHRAAMDDWVLERWGFAQEVKVPTLYAWVVRIPRADIRAREVGP